MNGLLRDTLAEMVSRKMFILFILVTFVLLLGVWGTWEIRHEISGPTEDMGGAESVQIVKPWVAEAFSKVMSVFVFFAVLATVGLIPRSLERGRAEFLLARPLSRARLLNGKLVSIWLVYGFMILVCGLTVYVVAALVHGTFEPGMIFLFLMTLVEYGIWLSIIGLAGVLFGSASWAMIIAFSVWVAQNLLSYHEQMRNFFTSSVVKYTLETLYYLVPKTGQMGDLAVQLATGQRVESWLPLWSSVAVAAVVYYFAIWAFQRRDY